MDNVISVLGRRLEVAEPLPAEPDEPGRDEPDIPGDGRSPPDDLPVLVAL